MNAPTGSNTNIQQRQRAPDPHAEFRALISSERVKNQLALALPQSGMTTERLVRIVLTALNKTPSLFNCTQTSVLAAVIQSAQLGLEPDGTLGLAYLVPYGNQCQFILGYRGLIELARRSGLVTNVDAQVVMRGDYFKYELGLTPTLRHIPQDMLELESEEIRNAALAALSGEHQSRIMAAYCVVTMKDGSKIFRVVTKSYVDKVRKASRGSDSASSPWRVWEEQMWQKTAIKQTLKYVPLSPDDRVNQALAVDERVIDRVSDVGEIFSTELPDPVPEVTRTPAQPGPSAGSTKTAPPRAQRAPAATQQAAPAPARKQPPLPGFGDDLPAESPAAPANAAVDGFVAKARQAQSPADAPPPPTVAQVEGAGAVDPNPGGWDDGAVPAGEEPGTARVEQSAEPRARRARRSAD